MGAGGLTEADIRGEFKGPWVSVPSALGSPRIPCLTVSAPLRPGALCGLAGLGVPRHEVCGVLKQPSPLLRRPRPGEVTPSSEARPCLPLRTPALPVQGYVSSSSASRCRVKAVLIHTPKGELVAAGEGGNLHLSLDSPWRLRPAPQVWAVLPQALSMLFPCGDLLRQCWRPRSHQVPLGSGWQVVVPGRAWFHLESHLASVLLPESLENQKCTASGRAVSTCKQVPQDPFLAAGEGVPLALLPTDCPPLQSHLALWVVVACPSCWGLLV